MIAKLYGKGLSMGEIGQLMGLNRHTIRMTLIALGVQARPARGKPGWH